MVQVAWQQRAVRGSVLYLPSAAAVRAV